MSKSKVLHELIQARSALPVPGVYDAFSARLVEQAGFRACQVSGFALAAAVLGLPDIGILSLRDQINAVQAIAGTGAIPVMADGDTGFGNALNTFHTVRMIEDAGAAGINIEDQTFPKRCGHMDDKAVIAMDEMVQKRERLRRHGAIATSSSTRAPTLWFSRGLTQPSSARDRLASTPIDAAFIGSCTNARLSDLRAAAAILKGRKVASGVQTMCTPGSMAVHAAAEAEGLDGVFKEAGFQWRKSGCSNCAGREGPIWKGLRVISLTNRNFENPSGTRDAHASGKPRHGRCIGCDGSDC